MVPSGWTVAAKRTIVFSPEALYPLICAAVKPLGVAMLPAQKIIAGTAA